MTAAAVQVLPTWAKSSRRIDAPQAARLMPKEREWL